MTIPDQTIQWLLEGDVAIQYQTHRDLMSTERPDLRKRISTGGWGKKFLDQRNPRGYWGRGFYQPKWTCSHYTLLDLRNLCIDPENSLIRESVEKIAREEKSADGGVNPAVTISHSDVCVNGMFLNYASYFGLEESLLKSVVDFLLGQHMADGGFNCYSNRSGATHSSLHSTLSVLEGITEYRNNGYTYRIEDLKDIEGRAKEFILVHRLYLSDRTGEVISSKFLRFSYPCRWRYDVLRALDYFSYSRSAYDIRMQSAIEVLWRKRKKNGTWHMQAPHPGMVHFDMEKAGTPSRWNTLRALRVLKHFTSGSAQGPQ